MRTGGRSKCCLTSVTAVSSSVVGSISTSLASKRTGSGAANTPFLTDLPMRPASELYGDLLADDQLEIAPPPPKPVTALSTLLAVADGTLVLSWTNAGFGTAPVSLGDGIAIVGVGVALLIAPSALRGCWGVRTLDRVWVRLIDRSALIGALTSRSRDFH